MDQPPAQKLLGQHFLRSARVLRQIIAAADLQSGETVLEVGPGRGILPNALLATGARVVAVEKDRRLIPLLAEKFAAATSSGQLQLVEADIRDLGLSSVGLKNNSYSIVANLPYYLTGQFLRQFLTAAIKPNKMVIMVQAEVAKRIIAADGRESLLSLSVKVYGQPRLVATVPAGSFSPPPKVDSAIIKIENITDKLLHEVGGKHFFDLISRGFAHKRKLLKSNLACSEEILLAGGVGPQARAEELKLEQWLCLAQKI